MPHHRSPYAPAGPNRTGGNNPHAIIGAFASATPTTTASNNKNIARCRPIRGIMRYIKSNKYLLVKLWPTETGNLEPATHNHHHTNPSFAPHRTWFSFLPVRLLDRLCGSGDGGELGQSQAACVQAVVAVDDDDDVGDGDDDGRLNVTVHLFGERSEQKYQLAPARLRTKTGRQPTYALVITASACNISSTAVRACVIVRIVYRLFQYAALGQ